MKNKIGLLSDSFGYQDKGFKGVCLDCGLDIYFQNFNYDEEQCESCEEEE